MQNFMQDFMQDFMLKMSVKVLLTTKLLHLHGNHDQRYFISKYPMCLSLDLTVFLDVLRDIPGSWWGNWSLRWFHWSSSGHWSLFHCFTVAGLKYRKSVAGKMAVFNGKEFILEETDWYLLDLFRLWWRYGISFIRMQMWVEEIMEKFMRWGIALLHCSPKQYSMVANLGLSISWMTFLLHNTACDRKKKDNRHKR